MKALKDFVEKIKGIFGRKEEQLELTEIEETIKRFPVKIDKLLGYNDVERVARIVKEGNLLLLTVKDLQKRDLAEFQNSIVKLKRICSQFKWDIVGIEEGYLIVAPEFAKIER